MVLTTMCLAPRLEALFKEAGSIARRKLLKANVSLCNLDHFFRFCVEFLSSVGVVSELLAVRHHLVAEQRDLVAVRSVLVALRQEIVAYHIIFIESQPHKKATLSHYQTAKLFPSIDSRALHGRRGWPILSIPASSRESWSRALRQSEAFLPALKLHLRILFPGRV